MSINQAEANAQFIEQAQRISSDPLRQMCMEEAEGEDKITVLYCIEFDFSKFVDENNLAEAVLVGIKGKIPKSCKITRRVEFEEINYGNNTAILAFMNMTHRQEALEAIKKHGGEDLASRVFDQEVNENQPEKKLLVFGASAGLPLQAFQEDWPGICTRTQEKNSVAFWQIPREKLQEENAQSLTSPTQVSNYHSKGLGASPQQRRPKTSCNQ